VEDLIERNPRSTGAELRLIQEIHEHYRKKVSVEDIVRGVLDRPPFCQLNADGKECVEFSK